jgi:uncharacterized protein
VIVVLDTNILVSALLTPHGPPGRILDLVLTGDLQLAYDDRVLDEYRCVLARPRFGFDAGDVSQLLDYIAAQGLGLTARPLRTELPDADDLPFLEVARAGGAMLVTGNQRHYPENARGEVTVQTPAEFLAWWLGTQPE